MGKRERERERETGRKKERKKDRRKENEKDGGRRQTTERQVEIEGGKDGQNSSIENGIST